MSGSANSGVTEEIPQPHATIIVLAGVAVGLAVAFYSGLIGGPWYVKAPIGVVGGSVLGGVLLGLAAGIRARMVALVREGRTPEQLARHFDVSAETIRDWVSQARSASTGRAAARSEE